MPEALWFESGRDGRLDAAIVLDLLLCRRNVAERLEETPMIEPVDPCKRREFDGFKTAPWPLLSDQLGLVETDNRLSEGVVVGVSDATDGRLNAGFGESLSVANGHVLHAAVAVVNQRLTSPDIAVVEGLLERVSCDVAAQRARHSPAHDPPRERIDHEGDVYHASPRRDVAQIRHPQSVRPRHSEDPIDTIQSAILQLVGDRRSDAFTAYNAAQTEVAHQSFDRTTSHFDASPIELLPHLVGAVNAIVLVPHALHFRLQRIVALGPFRAQLRLALSRFVLVVCRWGDRQYCADRLDPESVLVLIDIGDHHLRRRSSSAWAKKADAVRRMSFARRNSRFSRSSSLSRSRSLVVIPPRRPWSVSARRTQPRNVSAVHPIFDAIDPIAAHCDGYS